MTKQVSVPLAPLLAAEEEEDGTLGAAAAAAAGVRVERVRKDLGALSSEQRLAAVQQDAPELLQLIAELREGLTEVRSRVGPLLKEVSEGARGAAQRSAAQRSAAWGRPHQRRARRVLAGPRQGAARRCWCLLRHSANLPCLPASPPNGSRACRCGRATWLRRRA